MKCALAADFPVTDAACKEATGRTLAQWYAELDALGGVKLGRRNIVTALYSERKVPEWWATTIAVEYEKLRGEKKKDGLHEGYSICSGKTLNAPLDAVYGAFSDSAALGQWFGSGVKASVEDGGGFSTQDGAKGQYLRVRENKDLRFSWEAPGFSSASQVDIAFADKGKGKTWVNVLHGRLQTREETDGMREAWGAALNRLKELLEA